MDEYLEITFNSEEEARSFEETQAKFMRIAQNHEEVLIGPQDLENIFKMLAQADKSEFLARSEAMIDSLKD